LVPRHSVLPLQPHPPSDPHPLRPAPPRPLRARHSVNLLSAPLRHLVNHPSPKPLAPAPLAHSRALALPDPHQYPHPRTMPPLLPRRPPRARASVNQLSGSLPNPSFRRSGALLP
jgi:hypothetical protein